MITKELVSSNLKRATWREDETLTIDFIKGTSYTYSGVPREVFDELVSAESCGKYFVANVKSRYPFTQGDQEEVTP